MKLKIADESDFPYIKKLYKSSFPANERNFFFSIRKRVRQGKMEMFVIKQEDQRLGMVINSMYKDIVMITYFAVDDHIRNKGVGSKTLELIRQRYLGKRIYLEIERVNEKATNNKQRKMRKKFYIKNGFTESGYRTYTPWTDLELLNDNCLIEKEEYEGLYRYISSRFSYLITTVTKI